MKFLVKILLYLPCETPTSVKRPEYETLVAVENFCFTWENVPRVMDAPKIVTENQTLVNFS